MGKKIKYDYNEETGRSAVVIWTKGKRYRGTAVTNELDKDVMNSYTGLTIALARAEIKREDAKAAAAASEIKRLQKRIECLSEIQATSATKSIGMDMDLNDYINTKAEFANQLRDIRTKKEGIKLSEEGQ